MQYFVNGAKYSFSTILGTPVTATAISNGDPAQVSAATLPADGDIVLMRSNWTDLNDIATYAKNPAAGKFDLAKIDTSDEAIYVPDEDLPASFQVASGFTSLSQIREISQSGGDMNMFNFGYVDDSSLKQRSRPTDQNPLVLTFTMDYDPDMAWSAALEDVSRKQQLVVMRERLKTGDVLLYTGYVGYQPSPTRTRNENMTVTATMSINSDILRFPAAFFAGS
jgi:hypothetical protein